MPDEAVEACFVWKKDENGGIKLPLYAQRKSGSYCGVAHNALEHNSIKNHAGKDCQFNDWPTHKQRRKRQNDLLNRRPNDITNLAVFRTLSCPASASSEYFRKALQIAFG